jgi:hypothetical protein
VVLYSCPACACERTKKGKRRGPHSQTDHVCERERALRVWREKLIAAAISRWKGDSGETWVLNTHFQTWEDRHRNEQTRDLSYLASGVKSLLLSFFIAL